MIWTFEVIGKPRPKGSMVCQGGRQHHMVEDNPASKPWKLEMIRAIRQQLDIRPVKAGNRIIGWEKEADDPHVYSWERWEPYAGPVWVYAKCNFKRKIGADGEIIEMHRGGIENATDIGDTDKLYRNIGDALEQSGLLANDRQNLRWPGEGKRWCVADEQPGVIVKVVSRDH